MELRNIKTFMKVYDMKNFTRAAESLGYSQGAVTMQIKQLEEELGVPLFDRTGKVISLTEAGQSFLPHAIDILKDENEAIMSVKDDRELSGELRIITPSSQALGYFPGAVLGFHMEHPKVRINANTIDYNKTILDTLSQGQADLIFSMEEKSASPVLETLYEKLEPLGFVTYAGNPLANMSEVSLERILDEPVIVSGGENVSYNSILNRTIAAKGYKLNPVMELGSVMSIVQILKKGFGVSFIPLVIVRKELDDGTLRQVNVPGFPDVIYSQILCMKNRWIGPIMRAFVDYYKDYVENKRF